MPDYDAWLARIMDDTASPEDYNIFDMRDKDALAHRVKDEHIPRLWELGRSPEKMRRSCAWSLMRYLSPSEKTRLLQDAWDRPDLDNDERNALSWRVLDDPGLPVAYHEKIYDWILDNRASFVQALRKFLEVEKGNNFYGWIESSLKSRQQPLTKQWIYVAAAVLAADNPTDQAQAQEILNQGVASLAGTYMDRLATPLSELLWRSLP